MAINFEAANMAGYNNPKIEVFKAVLNNVNPSLDSYPAKSIILHCLSRGSFPVIILSVASGGYLLLPSEWDTNEVGDSIVFATPAGISSTTKFEIRYPDNDGEPTVSIE